jgi:hypothetical protein
MPGAVGARWGKCFSRSPSVISSYTTYTVVAPAEAVVGPPTTSLVASPPAPSPVIEYLKGTQGRGVDKRQTGPNESRRGAITATLLPSSANSNMARTQRDIATAVRELCWHNQALPAGTSSTGRTVH